MDFQPSDRVTIDHVYAGTALGAESEVHYCEREDLAAITLPDSFRVGELANIRDEWADEERHYLVAYTSNLSRQAHGMSGAAIWMPDIKGIVWTPNFRFAGTCINTFKKGYKAHRGPVVQVVKASIVRRFLEEEFGGAGRIRTDE
jgi:hypothetical protein